MSHNNYQVIFLGQIHDGFDEYDVRNNLKTLFKDNVHSLFDNAPTTINKNLSYDQAEKLCKKMAQLGAKCTVDPPENDEILSLELEISDDHNDFTHQNSNAQNNLTHQNSNIGNDHEHLKINSDNQIKKECSPEKAHSPRMMCPCCGSEQDEAKECIKCGIIIDRYQEKQQSKTEPCQPQKDILQEYLDNMSIPVTQSKPEPQKTRVSWLLCLVTSFVVVAVIGALGWSFYFFVYEKPWRYTDIESISIQDIDSPAPSNDQQRIESRKQTIAALQKALKQKKKVALQDRSKKSSGPQFRLKNIPLPLLKKYQGKYVWVTCDNDAVHQGSLYAVFTEQIILKKPRFNLTIPINRSMIRTVEYDMSESDYDIDAVKAYQAYKRRTEEALQEVSINDLGAYLGKNLRIYLNNGQLYEGVLTRCEKQKMTIQNIVYGQIVTLVIRMDSINRILF